LFYKNLIAAPYSGNASPPYSTLGLGIFGALPIHGRESRWRRLPVAANKFMELNRLQLTVELFYRLSRLGL